MGLFYAYLRYATYIPPPSYHPWSSQVCGNVVDHYLITFASREVADEWWRMISAPASPYAAYIKRISPQFYAQNNGSNVVSFFGNIQLPNSSYFSERIFFRPVDHNPTAIVPPAEVTDHISGRWYFIRSKADPHSHWYLRTSGSCVVCEDADCNDIHVSADYRTKFCVRVSNLAQISEDFVMIGKDKISIMAPEDHTLHVTDAGGLVATKGYQGDMDLVFGDLRNRFITCTEDDDDDVWEYVGSVEKGLGEAWELVG